MAQRQLHACCFRALRAWLAAQGTPKIKGMHYSYYCPGQVYAEDESILGPCCQHIASQSATSDLHWRTCSHAIIKAGCKHKWRDGSFEASAAVLLLREGD